MELHPGKRNAAEARDLESMSATTPLRARDGADVSTTDPVPPRVPTPTSRATAASPDLVRASPNHGAGDGRSSARQRAPSPKTQLAAAALLNGETGKPLARAIADAVLETAAVAGAEDSTDTGDGSTDAPGTAETPEVATALTAMKGTLIPLPPCCSATMHVN